MVWTALNEPKLKDTQYSVYYDGGKLQTFFENLKTASVDNCQSDINM